VKFEERYQLQVPLSQSERGTVWKAHDAKLAREVAVAVVESDAPDALRARFEQQMAKLVPLRHANVVRVFEAGKNGEGDPFASMEMVEGVSLASRMRDGPPMRVDQAVRMIVDVLGALTTLHAAGIAHGDIEPGNIFVKEAGGRVTPKLVGLGLNRAEQRAGQMPIEDEHLHVLAFASPTEARGSIGDSASDVYSTAAVLFSLLTGRLPRRGADADAMRASLRDRNVPAAGDVREEIAGPIADAIDAALAPEAKDRTDNADAFAKALRGALIKVRNPGSIETIVGERTTTPDASDDSLSAKRTQPRAAKASPAKAAFPTKATLPSKGGLPPKKPAAPLAPAKPLSESVVEKMPFERISGLFEDAPAKKPESLEFEAISGLLEIASDAPPRVAPPTPAVKLPPPARMPKEPEPKATAPKLAEKIEEKLEEPEEVEELEPEAPIAAEPTAPINTQPSLFDPEPAEEAAEELAEEEPDLIEAPTSAAVAAPPPPAPVKERAEAKPAPKPIEEPIDADPQRFSHTDLDGEYAVPKARIPVWAWGAGAVAIAAMVGLGIFFMVDDDDPAVAVTHNEPREQEATAEPDPPAEPANDPVAVEDVAAPEPAPEPEREVAPEPEPVVLTFTGVPDGASVTVDGEDIEGDRVELAATESERRVEVRLEGHEPWSRTVGGGESAELEVELARIPEPVARVERPAVARVERPRVERPREQRTTQTARRRRGRPVAAQDPGF
jgi:serine/threonine protein kinase